MLQSIRQMAQSWILKTLMILLVLSFGAWGVGDMFRSNPMQKDVATIGDISITAQTLEQRFQAMLPEIQRIYGPNITLDQARQIGVLEQTLTTMVEEASFSQEVARLGLNVPDSEILKRIASEPSLKDADGKFNKARWETILRRSGMSERSFVDQEREQTARNIVFMSILSNIKAPKIMIDSLYQARGAKRILDVVAIDNKSSNGIGKADKAALEAFYEKNKDLYLAPEYRGVTIAKLSVNSVKEDVNITDDDLQKAYDERQAELKEPQTRDITQLVLQDEAKAKKLSDSAVKSSDLIKAAKAGGLTPISMKKISEQSVLPALRESLFALKENGVSAPVKSALGWHVMQVKKIRKGGVPKLAEIKKNFRKRLKEERTGDNLARLVNQWDDELAAGQSLEDIADMLKLRLTRVAAMDSKGETPEGKDVKDLPLKDVILRTVFDLESGESGPVLDDGLGNYYVVRADSVTLSQHRPIKEVMKAVKKGWKSEKQSEVAAAKAEKIAEALKKGKSAKKFAAQRGVTVRMSKPISFLGDMDKNIPVSAMNNVFAMKKGDVITANDNGKHYVLRLDDIVPVNIKKPEASRTKVVEDVRRQLPKDYIEEYGVYLQELFPRHIDTNILQQLKGRGSDL